MKRVIAWLAGLVGIAALGRWLARRGHHGQQPAVDGETTPSAGARAHDATGTDPAEALRRRLAEAREAGPAPEPAAAAEEEETLDERRARVHAKAREAIDAMGSDGTAG